MEAEEIERNSHEQSERVRTPIPSSTCINPSARICVSDFFLLFFFLGPMCSDHRLSVSEYIIHVCLYSVRCVTAVPVRERIRRCQTRGERMR